MINIVKIEQLHYKHLKNLTRYNRIHTRKMESGIGIKIKTLDKSFWNNLAEKVRRECSVAQKSMGVVLINALSFSEGYLPCRPQSFVTFNNEKQEMAVDILLAIETKLDRFAMLELMMHHKDIHNGTLKLTHFLSLDNYHFIRWNTHAIGAVYSFVNSTRTLYILNLTKRVYT